MKVAVLDLCLSPPALAFETRVGQWRTVQVEDSWRGAEKEGFVLWDGDEWNAESGQGRVVVRPSASLERLDRQSAASALFPLLRRCGEAALPGREDRLLILAPMGVSRAAAKGLRIAARAAGWRSTAWVADGAAFFAAARAAYWRESGAQWVVVRPRKRCVEASLISVSLEKANARAEFICQARGKSAEEAIAGILSCETLEHSGPRYQLDRPATPSEDIDLWAVGDWFGQIQRCKGTLNLRRNGMIGLRSESSDLVPLMDEVKPVASSTRRVIESPGARLASLDLCFGYFARVVQVMATFPLINNRADRPPKHVNCEATRSTNGGVLIRLDWEKGELECRMRFPAILS